MTYLNPKYVRYIAWYIHSITRMTYPRRIQHVRSIFAHHGKNFFRCMSKMYGWQRTKQIRHAESYNVGKPPTKRRRVPYWKELPVDSHESSETVDTSSGADEKYPFFERSQKITPHAVVHLADQVIMAGTYTHFPQHCRCRIVSSEMHNTSCSPVSHLP